MRKKVLLLVGLLHSLAILAQAQSKAEPQDPHVIVGELYAAHDAGAGPFFQTRSHTKSRSGMVRCSGAL